MVAVALLISWGLVSGESMFLPFLVPLPLVALSLIYTDMPPAGWAGVLVCLYYGGVLFTGGLRLHRGGGIGRVTCLAIAALLLTILLLALLLALLLLTLLLRLLLLAVLLPLLLAAVLLLLAVAALAASASAAAAFLLRTILRLGRLLAGQRLRNFLQKSKCHV